MRTITAIIVEDEEYSRLSLEEKLRVYHPAVRVVDSCGDSASALESILEHRPDLLFLDIELPGNNALWLVERLKEVSSAPLPHIIFTTAFSESEYMLRAIRLDAADYLIKPVGLEELASAVEKVVRRIEEKEQALPRPAANGGRAHRFRTHNSFLNLRESDIVCFEADTYCTTLYTAGGGKETLFERLADIERRMAGVECMCRCGRKHLVNCDYVYKLDVKNNVCHFQLPSGQALEVALSQNGINTLMRRISGAR